MTEDENAFVYPSPQHAHNPPNATYTPKGFRMSFGGYSEDPVPYDYQGDTPYLTNPKPNGSKTRGTAK
jgi:hypothetical protein